MSVYREKDQPLRQERKQRDTSVSKKRGETGDRRPIITQEKAQPIKTSKTSLKEKSKPQTEKTISDKTQKRKTETQDQKKVLEKDRKTSKQDAGPLKAIHRSIGIKDSKLEGIYLKEPIEKKTVRRSESVKKEKPKEKSVKVKEGGETRPKTHRDRTRTRTLSPTEIKQLVPTTPNYDVAASGDFRRETEETWKKPEENEAKESENEYEDDFEDYDSDFEEDDTESPKSPSPPAVSPTPKPEQVDNSWKTNLKKQQIEAVIKSIEKENQELQNRKKSITKQYEDDSDKENMSVPKMIDFSLASKKQKKTKKAADSKKRGEELLNMISLDTISYSILEIPPTPYEEFMKVFGKSNTKQVYTQTNEDNLDEEVQTDEISLSNKWVQNPAEYLGRRQTGNEISYILTKEERLGVGGDTPSEEETTIYPKTTALSNFLSWASQLVLIVLESKSGNLLSLDNMPNHSKAMAFGDGFVILNVSEIPFLAGRSVTQLCLLSTSGRLLSIHTNKEKSFQKCMICIWSLRELSKPLKVLMASNRVSSCCFGPNQGNLIFAGLTDGSICLWDLREPSTFHARVTNSPEWSLQSPTYTTAGNMRDSGHSCSVVAVRLLNKIEQTSSFGDFTPMQICSLDNDGTIIIWTVIQLEKAQPNDDDLGLAHWGRVKLVKSSTFSVFANLKDEIPGLYITCNDILINDVEDDGFYVANSFGSVYHCSPFGSPMKPKFFIPSKQDAIVETTCLELCPFDGNYFLVGCADGTIRLHSRHQENPLICLNGNVVENEKEAAVVSLSWMTVRPCVFFALDSLSRINIWDLGASDMYPDISIALTQKKITCMKLFPNPNPRQAPFIVIGTEGGGIEIHKLKKEFGCRTAVEIKNEMKMFLKYVSIL